MRILKILIFAVISFLFIALFSGILQGGDLNEKEKLKKVRMMEKRNNPFRSERWARKALGQKKVDSFLPDFNVSYLSSILWTGMRDVQVVGDYAYCAFVNGLVILNVLDPANPSFVSKLYFQGEGEGIFVQGDYAYLADKYAGLKIIDVTDPANPDLVGGYNTRPAFGVFVLGSLAYVAGGWSGLLILNVSNPANPESIGSYDTPGVAYDVFVQFPYAYVADGDEGLMIIDVSLPDNPDSVGSWDTPGYALGVFVEGSLAYVADEDSGLRIIDVGDPANPYEVGSYDIGRAYDVFVQNNLAYVAAFFSGLRIIDVSDPSNPSWVSTYDTPYRAYAVFVQYPLAYVADDWGGLQIIDVSDPANPSLAGSYDTPSYSYDVFVEDTLAYVANWYTGLQIVNISDPANPDVVGNYDTPDFVMDVGVFVEYPYAYVAAGFYGGLQIINVIDPAHPESVGSYDTPGYACDVFVQYPLAYVADGESGLQIINVSNPANPESIGSYNTPGSAGGVFVQNGLAYVADGSKGLQIIDVSNPTSPSYVGDYDTPDVACDVFVQDTLAYVADRYSGLRIIDVSDSTNPDEAGSYDTPGQALGVFVQDNLAHVADNWGGLQIIDVSDPSDPDLVGSYDTPGGAHGVFARQNLVYLADKYSLMILMTPGDFDCKTIWTYSASKDEWTGMTKCSYGREGARDDYAFWWDPWSMTYGVSVLFDGSVILGNAPFNLAFCGNDPPGECWPYNTMIYDWYQADEKVTVPYTTDQEVLFINNLYARYYHNYPRGAGLPLDIEQTAIGFDDPYYDAHNIIFQVFTITNTGDTPIPALKFAIWLDWDLMPDFYLDKSGGDSLLGLGWQYNTSDPTPFGTMILPVGGVEGERFKGLDHFFYVPPDSGPVRDTLYDLMYGPLWARYDTTQGPSDMSLLHTTDTFSLDAEESQTIITLTGEPAPAPMGGFLCHALKFAGFYRGDVNMDGMLNLGDVVYTTNYKFRGGPAPMPFVSQGDVDGDGEVDLSDVIRVAKTYFGLPGFELSDIIDYARFPNEIPFPNDSSMFTKDGFKNLCK